MKRILCLLLLLSLVLAVKVKADSGGPMVIEYKATVSNKNGAVCYERDGNNYKKKNKTLPYGKELEIYAEAENGYINISEDECWYIKVSDIKTKSDSLSITAEGVEKITPVRAIVLAKGGLNLRKGPAVAYGRITTILQYTVVDVSYRAGSYWNYVEYNGKKGWISATNGYLGFQNEEILYSHKQIEIKDQKGNIIGQIPPFTEIVDYLDLVDYYNGANYYVVYNLESLN